MGQELKLSRLENVSSRLLEKAKSISVLNREEAEYAKSIGLQATRFQKRIESIRKILVKPHNDEVSRINKIAKNIASPIIAAKNLLRETLTEFTQIEREKEEKEKQAYLKDKQEEILRREEEEKRQASLKGEEKQIIEDKQEKQIPILEPVKKESLVKTRKVWVFEVTDIKELSKYSFKNNADLILPNETKIRKLVQSGVIRNLPGVKIWQKETSIMR